MRCILSSAVVVLASLATATSAFAIDFNPFVVRHANGSGIVPQITENAAGDGVRCATPLSGQKVGYGTSEFDGKKFNTLQTVNFEKVYGRDQNPPYLNVWLTDGTNYAIVATEGDYLGKQLSAENFFIFETNFTNLNQMLNGMNARRNGIRLQKEVSPNVWKDVTGADLAHLTIDSPTTFGPNVTTGAPKAGYGVNILWGDTESNYKGIYHYKNLTVNGTPVPEPASLALFGLGSLAFVRRRH